MNQFYVHIFLTIVTFTRRNAATTPSLVLQSLQVARMNCGVILTSDNLETPLSKIFELGLTTHALVLDFRKFNRHQISLHVRLAKHSANCALALISVELLQDATLNYLQNLLIPTMSAMASRDEDYFLIYANPEIGTQILMSEQFGMLIKYKLLIESHGMHYLKSVCFYCEPGYFKKEKIIRLKPELLTLELMYPDWAQNLHGQMLRVVGPKAVQQHFRLNSIPEGIKLEKSGGLYLKVLDELERLMNFTYVAQYSSGGGTGFRLPNGTWVGSAGDVINGVADIGVITAATYQRYIYMGYSHTISYEWLSIAVGHQEETYSWKATMWPFHGFLWLIVIAAFGIFVTLLTIYSAFAKFRFSSVHFVFGTLLEQSLRLPSTSGFRLFSLLWFLLVLVIRTAYKSKLVGCLGFPLSESIPGTFTELAESKYKIGFCFLGGAAFEAFSHTKNPTYNKIMQRMEIFHDMTSCYRKVIEGNRVCIGYKSTAEYVLTVNLTDPKYQNTISVTSDSTFLIACGLALRKGVPWRLNFDAHIKRWSDTGILQQWYSNDLVKMRKLKMEGEHANPSTGQPQMSSKHGDERQILRYSHLKAVFALPLLGLGLGAITFCYELFSSKFTCAPCQNVFVRLRS